VRAALDRYRPPSPAAAADRDRFAEVVATLDAPCDRARPAHVTVSAYVVDDGRVLLHRHKRSGLVLPPGGHVDPGESLAGAAEREVREETGLAVRVVEPLLVDLLHVGPGARCALHLDVGLRAALVGRAGTPDPGESDEITWVGAADLDAQPSLPADVRAAAARALGDHRV
jgi:8-oxo-dGTP pyrophosphatase MutT (NUDIX family)